MPRDLTALREAFFCEARKVARSLLLHLGHPGELADAGESTGNSTARLTQPDECLDPALNNATMHLEIPSRKLTIRVALHRLIGTVQYANGLPLRVCTGNYKVVGLGWYYFGQGAHSMSLAQIKELQRAHSWGGTPEVPEPDADYRSAFCLVLVPSIAGRGAEIEIRHCSTPPKPGEIELARVPYQTFVEADRRQAGERALSMVRWLRESAPVSAAA